MTVRYATAMSEKRDVTIFQLRVPSDMHQRFKAIAEAEAEATGRPPSTHWAYLKALREWLACQDKPRP